MYINIYTYMYVYKMIKILIQLTATYYCKFIYLVSVNDIKIKL